MLTSGSVAPVAQRQTMLMTPTCGLASMPQAMAVRIGGMKNGSVISTSSVPRNGVSVRATIQARNTAIVSDGMVFASEMPTVLARTIRFWVVMIER